MKLFRRLAEELRNNPVVVATVIQTKGSTPREIGAKMLVLKNGHFMGTIGGGAGEAKVIAAAQEVFENGGNRLVEVDLTRLEAEGICGGKMQIWLELWRGNEALNLSDKILRRLKTGTEVKIATPLNSQGKSYLFEENQLPSRHVFLETLKPAPVLLIVGAGHVGIELAKIADAIDFDIIVQDERAEWALPKNFPPDAEILTGSVGEILTRFSNYREFYAALVTRGFEYDLKALDALLASDFPCRYIGMIGSDRRVRQVFEALEKKGIEKEKLAKIKAPIGLKIGALTPAEIAVSIAAELISIRRREV